jgi:hypothetical protein
VLPVTVGDGTGDPSLDRLISTICLPSLGWAEPILAATKALIAARSIVFMVSLFPAYLLIIRRLSSLGIKN